ncbi:MAG: hypothetical protein IJX86_00615 [Lachnospiraceae bacterium]|nr:hypothetical protein [Lachnospiraceae bacterium]
MFDENKILNLSSFLEDEIAPTVLGAFLRRSEYIGNEYIFTYFSFRSSKFYEFCENYYQDYANCINQKSGIFPYWQLNISESNDPIYISSKYKGVYILKNDLDIELSDEQSGNNFTNRLLNKIRRQSFLFDYAMEEERKDFLRGYLDVAMSYDGSGFFACDYHCSSRADIRKISLLMDHGLMNPEYFNFNTRLTEDTTQKDDQFRVSWKYYLCEIGTYNKYRMECIHASDTNAAELTIDENSPGIYYFNIDYVALSPARRNEKTQNFISKYNAFINMAYGYRIEGNQDAETLRQYRQLFGMDDSNNEDRRTTRNQRIVSQVYDDEPDECVCCKNRYNIADRSFYVKRRVNGLAVDKYFFEIHHAISFSNGQSQYTEENVLDVIENLVKVCPTCHTCMTAKRGREEDIKILLNSMLDNSPKVKDFAEGYFGTTDKEELIIKIYEVLH